MHRLGGMDAAELYQLLHGLMVAAFICAAVLLVCIALVWSS